MNRTQIYLPQKQHDYLKSLALKRRTSVSEVIWEIIEEAALGANVVVPGKSVYRNIGMHLTAPNRVESMEMILPL